MAQGIKMTTDVQPNVSESINTNIGDKLKQRRLELGFDERHVATELKIAIDQVQALEVNDFNYFRSVTFARGFLKSYCRLLNIDHVGIIEEFDSQRANAESTIKPVDKIHKQTHLGDPIVIFISVVIVAIFAFLVFWWPANTKNISADDLNNDVSENADAAQTPKVVVPIEQASPEKESPLVEDASPESEEQFSTETESSAQELAPTVERNDVVDSEKSKITDSDIVTGLSAETAAILKEAGVSPDDVIKATKDVALQDTLDKEAVASVEADYLDDIVIDFASDCWTEIRDANGTILFSGVKSANSTLALTGNGPYRVVLGFANGVSSLKYKGETFDFSSFTNKNLARFELK